MVTKGKKGKASPIELAAETRKIDDDWRADVREQMERHDVSLSELAARCGVAKATLSVTLNPHKGRETFRQAARMRDVFRELDEALAKGEPRPPLPGNAASPTRKKARNGAVAAILPNLDDNAKLRDRYTEHEIRNLGLLLFKGLTIDEVEAFVTESIKSIAKRQRQG
jgi:hypothetical protein